MPLNYYSLACPWSDRKKTALFVVNERVMSHTCELETADPSFKSEPKFEFVAKIMDFHCA